MKDQNSYNLNGLRAVFWGMLLEIVSNVGASGMGAVRTKFSGEMLNYIGIGFSAVSILAFLMVIIGLSQVGKYSAHFRRSRNYYLWSLLLAVVAVGLAVVAVWFIDTDQDSSRTMLGTVGMIVGAMVLILLAGWLDILKIKQMMTLIRKITHLTVIIKQKICLIRKMFPLSEKQEIMRTMKMNRLIHRMMKMNRIRTNQSDKVTRKMRISIF